jgi:alkylated DNA repair dioxygenase AlkB
VLLQASLFDGGAIAPTDAEPVRTRLDDRCWVDHASGWLSGADDLLVELAETLEWRPGRRLMWDRWVDEPRLHFGGSADSIDAHPAIREIGETLSARYEDDLRMMFANWYRDGDDAVAWHADRIGRKRTDPLVAIVSLGGPRRFLLRPMGGGRSRPFLLHSGDLLVMGGATQHRWQHSVPRMRGASSRMSLTYRVERG